ncbi:hypothetical protein FQA39_LY04390 [Lamprigera yunnana]|nr:hypothetical protein FQA39_LY04390 [Lamprigera yunnana]
MIRSPEQKKREERTKDGDISVKKTEERVSQEMEKIKGLVEERMKKIDDNMDEIKQKIKFVRKEMEEKEKMVLGERKPNKKVSADEPVHYNLVKSLLRCKDELKINQTIIDEVVDETGKIDKIHSVIKDLYLCGFKKSNYISEDDVFDYERFTNTMISITHKNETAEALEFCKDVKGIDVAETVIKVLNCIIDRKGFP